MIKRPRTASTRVKSKCNNSTMLHKLYGYEHFNSKLHNINIHTLTNQEKHYRLCDSYQPDHDYTFITHTNAAKPKYVECDYSNISDYIKEIDYMSQKRIEEYDTIKEIRLRLTKARQNLDSHKKIVMSIIGHNIMGRAAFKRKVHTQPAATPMDVMKQLTKIQERMNQSAISIEQQLRHVNPIYTRQCTRPVTPYKGSRPQTCKASASRRPYTSNMDSKNGVGMSNIYKL